MRFKSCREVAVLAFVATAACTDSIPTTPSVTTDLTQVPQSMLNLNATATVGDEQVVIGPALDIMNARLRQAGAGVRVAKAELMLDARRWDRRKGTVILAKDFTRGIGAEWVRGDLRRGGRRGVTYTQGSNAASAPYVFTDDGSAFRPLTQSEQKWQVEKGMDAWRDLRCSSDPISRVDFATGSDPDLLNDLFLTGAPSAHYLQPSDIVQSGWQPIQFFQAFAGADAAAILGVTFTFVFVDDAGVATDVDQNGEADIGLAEIYYNDIYAWSRNGRPTGTIDFFSVIAHESGHALGLGHWGLIFVREEDAADGITADEIRFRPKAMMNALYVGGRNRIEVSDRRNFCLIWETRGNGKKDKDRR